MVRPQASDVHHNNHNTMISGIGSGGVSASDTTSQHPSQPRGSAINTNTDVLSTWGTPIHAHAPTTPGSQHPDDRDKEATQAGDKTTTEGESTSNPEYHFTDMADPWGGHIEDVNDKAQMVLSALQAKVQNNTIAMNNNGQPHELAHSDVCAALLPTCQQMLAQSHQMGSRLRVVQAEVNRFKQPLSEPLDKYGSWGSAVKVGYAAMPTLTGNPEAQARQMRVREMLEEHFQSEPTPSMREGLPHPAIGGVPAAVSSEVAQFRVDTKLAYRTGHKLPENHVQDRIHAACNMQASRIQHTHDQRAHAERAAAGTAALAAGNTLAGMRQPRNPSVLPPPKQQGIPISSSSDDFLNFVASQNQSPTIPAPQVSIPHVVQAQGRLVPQGIPIQGGIPHPASQAMASQAMASASQAMASQAILMSIAGLPPVATLPGMASISIAGAPSQSRSSLGVGLGCSF